MQTIGLLKNKYLIILVFIVLLGGILRLLGLNKYPVGFTPDEASFGYDAYSLLKTGKDQWGHSWPIILESFGDYKAPILSYLMIPAVAVGGLDKVPIRVPNAVVGVLAILVTYFVVRRLFRSEATALASSFFLAISPWHIMMSRGAFEANLTTLFLPLGILLLLKGFEKNKYLYLGALVLGLNMFTYHAAKLVTPIVAFLFTVIFWKDIVTVSKKHLLSVGTIFLLFIGLTAYTFTIGAGARVSDVSIFKGITDASAEYKVNAYSMGVNPFLARIIYSKFEIPVVRFLDNYVSYFSPQYLFTKGPSEATYGMIPGRGVLYWFELPFLLGFLASLFKAKDKKIHLFILGWVLASPIPAALTTGAGYAGNRSEIMLPALQIIIAIGFYQVYLYLKNNFTRGVVKTSLFFYSIFSLILFGGFLADYFLISPARNAGAMLSGDLEVANFLIKNVPASSTVVVSKSLSEPQIYIAFAGSWNPAEYQTATKTWNYKKLGLGWVDQLPSYKLGNYTFKGINMDDYKSVSEADYVVGKPGEFPNDVTVYKVINLPNGKPGIYVVRSSDLMKQLNK